MIICLPLILLTACDVHEWPDIPEAVEFHLRLKYETDIVKWNHIYEDGVVHEESLGEVYDNHLSDGTIRYTIRAYPIVSVRKSEQESVKEFVFTKDIADGYDHEVTLELPGGDYNIMVWSDLQQNTNVPYFYNTAQFTEISLQNEHCGNTDYRDAFRGNGNISLIADIVERLPDTLDIRMERPLAKFEFIATDLEEFLDRELDYKAQEAATRGEELPTRVDTDEYDVVIYYPGYMPSAYNMNIDKPVDSALGVMFNSKINPINDKQASLGFDYVFVNGVKSGVTVQIGIYDKDNREVALSEPIYTPLSRSHHTILKGSFMIRDASGGLMINPEFDGEHNVII